MKKPQPVEDLSNYLGNAQLWAEGIYIQEMIADTRLRKNEVFILLMIATRDWGGREGVCRMSTSNFAQILKIKRASAQRMVRNLQSYGYIQQIYRVKMPDSRVKATTSWKQAQLLCAEGKILRSYFRILKHGIRGHKTKSKHKKQT